MKNLSEKAVGIAFGSFGSLQGIERRPGEPQGGLQELQNHDLWSPSSDYELQAAAGSPKRARKVVVESPNHVQSSSGELHRGIEEFRRRS